MLSKPLLDQLLNRLGQSNDPRWLTVGLRLMDSAIPQTAEGFGVTMEYARASEPFARYFAARRLGRFAAGEFSETVWRTLAALATDSISLVREGAAWGIAVWLEQDTASLSRLRDTLTDPNTPRLLRRAILMGTLPVMRNQRTDRLDAVLALLDAAASDARLEGVVAFIVRRQFAKHYPAQAGALVARWANADDITHRHLAARLNTNNPVTQEEVEECPE